MTEPQVDNAMLSFFQQDKDLVTDNRPLRLRLAHPTQMLEDVLLPQRVDGSEAVCGSVEYRILCVSLDAYIPLKELIALPVAVDVVTDRGDLRSICGIVTEARAGDSDGGLASYQLVLRDALSIMEKRINTRVFRDKNEVEIVQLILDEWMQTNPIIGACFRYEIDVVLARANFPQREFTMQYNESDAAFIRRLLKRRGVAWFFRAEQDKFPSHTMVLFNHTVNLKPNAADIIRYHRDAATEERDTITSWCAVRTLQPEKVTRYSWDYKQPWNEEFMTTSAQSAMDQGESGNEMSASLDDYQVLAPHAGDDYDDFCQLGQLAMNRHDMDSKCFQGEGSVRDMCVGEYFTLEGHPEIDGHARSECEFVVTSMRLAIFNNLPKELAGRVERLFASNRWTQSSDQFLFDASKFSTRVRVSFNAVRRGIPIVPAYDGGAETPVTPMQSAIVVGPEGEEVHCDELGRVKIRFSTTRAADHEHAQGAGASDSDVDSAWVRVASNWAGSGPGSANQFGSLYLPRVGSEVLVAFLGGDPDKPIIVGQTYNQRGQPPAISQGGGLPGNRFLSGIKSREVRGTQANYLRFDDSPGEISTQLACDQTSARLNLGFITHERAHGAGEKRGEGAELTTEKSVAIRGLNGVLISTEASNDGSVLMRDGLSGMIEALSGIAAQLCELSSVHSRDRVSSDYLQALSERIRNWSSEGQSRTGKSLLAGTSNDGIAIATPSSIAIGAQEPVGLISAKNVQVHAGESAETMAMKGVTLFSHEEGIKVISAKGLTQVQSQDGDIEIVASGKIRICAGEGVEITAPEVKLASKGAQANYGGDKVVHQSKGDFVVKSSKFEHTKGGSGSDTSIDFPSTEVKTDERVYLVSSQSGKPVAGRKYKLELPDGRVIEGTSDDEGRTELVKSDEIGEMKVTIFPDDAAKTAGEQS
jgi:type VI secretion system secreted protein VgrG